MTDQATKLLAEALRLSEDDRSELAARLLESLDAPTDAGVEAAWDGEIQERLRELDSGQVKPIPWSEARRQIMEDFDEPGES
jgi:putative addiction module component (TIGR02574 family)